MGAELASCSGRAQGKFRGRPRGRRPRPTEVEFWKVNGRDGDDSRADHEEGNSVGDQRGMLADERNDPRQSNAKRDERSHEPEPKDPTARDELTRRTECVGKERRQEHDRAGRTQRQNSA